MGSLEPDRLAGLMKAEPEFHTRIECLHEEFAGGERRGDLPVCKEIATPA